MGRIICCGLGPGDPDLMSVRADRIIRSAAQISYFRKKGRPGQARRIVDRLLLAGVKEYPLEYPVTTELPADSEAYHSALSAFYAECTEKLIEWARTDDLVVLCEGDPFFYGSFMHLYVRLQGRADVQVVAGIPGMAGCWNATGIPMTWGNDILTVLMGTLPEAELVHRMTGADALVVMKTGRHLGKVRRALAQAGRLSDAWLVEHGTMPNERIIRLSDVGEDECPYFALVLVHGKAKQAESAD